MGTEDKLSSTAPEPARESGQPYLTRRDIDRLTNYKWRYSLESHGFSTEQAGRLLFARWLYGHQLLHS